MNIRKCLVNDVTLLAHFNKQLIEDEKSDNPMNLDELEVRMKDFLTTEYNAYFFEQNDTVVGYALVKHTVNPLYLRQFFVCREYRKQHIGYRAFQLLLEELQVDTLDVEVLSLNEAGIKFWEKCGFVERSRYLRWKSNP